MTRADRLLRDQRNRKPEHEAEGDRCHAPQHVRSLFGSQVDITQASAFLTAVTSTMTLGGLVRRRTDFPVLCVNHGGRCRVQAVLNLTAIVRHPWSFQVRGIRSRRASDSETPRSEIYGEVDHPVAGCPGAVAVKARIGALPRIVQRLVPDLHEDSVSLEHLCLGLGARVAAGGGRRRRGARDRWRRRDTGTALRERGLGRRALRGAARDEQHERRKTTRSAGPTQAYRAGGRAARGCYGRTHAQHPAPVVGCRTLPPAPQRCR